MGIKPSQFIWSQGELIPWEQATVHVLSHGLHYGSSVFEGIRAYNTPEGPAFFRLEEHIDRLFESARIHRMDVPYSKAQLHEACHAVVRENHLASAYIRPIIFYGYGSLGVTPMPDTIRVDVAAFEWGAYLGEEALAGGVDVGVCSWQRPAPNTFPTMAKAGGNYLLSSLMSREAKRNGYAEGIALDSRGFLSEGPGENLFIVKGGVIYTPSIENALLVGITRDSIIRIAQRLGYEVREQTLPREMLYVADELFFSGTAAEVTPIRSVDGLTVGEGRRGPVTEAIQKAFFDLVSGQAEDFAGWLKPMIGKEVAV